MKYLSNIYRTYDEAVWVRVFGTLLTKIAQFMMYPFLVLYMTEKFNSSVTVITAIIGLESLAGFLINLSVGGLSDRIGRKATMMVSLGIQSICLTAFIFIDSLWLFAIFMILLGAGTYIFFPAADAQIADSVSEERRAKVYSLIGTAASIGIAIGPLVGMFAFKENPSFVFLFFVFVSVFYLFLVWWKIPETLPKKIQITNKDEKSNIFKISIGKNKYLFFITLLVIPTSLLSAQDWSTFPLHLKEQSPENYQWMYSSLLSIGSITAAIIQIWIALLIENKNASRMIFIGYILTALAAFGYAFFINYGLLIMVRVVAVVGSCFYTLHLNKFISTWAPIEKRGRYFSIFGLHWRVSEALGPFIGGLLLTSFSGKIMFSVFSGLLIISGVTLFYILNRIEVYQTKPTTSVTGLK